MQPSTQREWDIREQLSRVGCAIGALEVVEHAVMLHGESKQDGTIGEQGAACLEEMLCHTRYALLKTDEWLEKERQAEADHPTPAPKDAMLRDACGLLQETRGAMLNNGLDEASPFYRDLMDVQRRWDQWLQDIDDARATIGETDGGAT